MNISKPQFDIVVVGSGPSGVNAAHPLLKAGRRVAIVDGGLNGKKKGRGYKNFSGFNLSNTSNAYDLIRKNRYVFDKTYELLNIQSDLEIIQSLAKGGLSEVWHRICDLYTNDELKTIGLPADEIQKEYEEVSKRINLKVQTRLDLHSKLLIASANKKASLKNTVYVSPLAFRYRASSALEDLKRFKNFTYIPNQLVFTVKDKTKYIEIQSFSIDKLAKSTILARFAILAAGSINTTRILQRSLQLFNYKTTFLTKAHNVTVCLHLRTLGNKADLKKLRSTQLAIASNETHRGLGTFFVHLYKFNPAKLHKALKYIPLPKPIASTLLSIIAPSLVAADIRFPAFESNQKFCRLKNVENQKDILEISFKESVKEKQNRKRHMRTISQKLRSLGLIPLKTISDYATAHYAGGVPFQHSPGKLSVDSDGKLHQANRIYVADSSTWRALPPKPPTFTIMANAARVAKNVLKDF